tara:strand:- start:245 stop:1126 length:882 start_codon:yes stop_codon:yes gene_type:complete
MLNAYRFGGKWLFKPLLLPVIVYFYLANKNARRSSGNYLSMLKKFSPDVYQGLGCSRLLSFKHLWYFGDLLLDKLAVWMGHIGINDVTVHNGSLMNTLLQQKRGAVLLISHLGNFEICRALNSQHRDMKLTILIHTKHAQKFNQLLQQYDDSDSANIKLLQVTELNVATAMELSERIDQGGFIAIAADRVAIDNPVASTHVDFLGASAAFPRGPFLIAAILKAPLISLQCIRLKGRYHIHFDSLSEAVKAPRRERDELITQLTKDFAQLLQKYCLQAPLQWFNFFTFWSSNEK